MQFVPFLIVALWLQSSIIVPLTPTTEAMRANRRKTPRLDIHIPVSIELQRGAVFGVTRDLSAGGIYFYIDQDLAEGSRIDFIVTFPPELTMAKSLRVRCTSQVLRTDSTPNGYGIAAQIQRFEFLPPTASYSTGVS